ncbi:MSMEG_4193 family putative phosphomutase, partial [Mycobacterium montefiorense]
LVEDRLAEVDYGDWTGRKIGELANEPLWRVVQAHPSAAVFPGGEGLAQVQARAVAAVREHDRRLSEEHNGDALWVACTHGDVIKSLIADAYGMHLDGFQRVTADPASVSVIRYTTLRPFVLHVNHTGGRLAAALRAGPPPSGDAESDKSEEPQQQPAEAEPSSDAVVGGTTD